MGQGTQGCSIVEVDVCECQRMVADYSWASGSCCQRQHIPCLCNRLWRCVECQSQLTIFLANIPIYTHAHTLCLHVIRFHTTTLLLHMSPQVFAKPPDQVLASIHLPAGLFLVFAVVSGTSIFLKVWLCFFFCSWHTCSVLTFEFSVHVHVAGVFQCLRRISHC